MTTSDGPEYLSMTLACVACVLISNALSTCVGELEFIGSTTTTIEDISKASEGVGQKATLKLHGEEKSSVAGSSLSTTLGFAKTLRGTRVE